MDLSSSIYIIGFNNSKLKEIYENLIIIGYKNIINNINEPYNFKNNIKKIMEADIICLAPEWKKNEDLIFEINIAKKLKIPLMILKDNKLMPRISIIGISGWARSGKDTFADLLIKDGYKKISFANPLKDALIILNPYIKAIEKTLKEAIEVYGWDEIKKYNEVRRLLQTMGTEVGRNLFGENIWINLALDNVEDGEKIVIADVRFKNEAKVIKEEFNGKIIRIVRPGIIAPNNHISEHELDDYNFDKIVNNNGSIEDLIKITSI